MQMYHFTFTDKVGTMGYKVEAHGLQDAWNRALDAQRQFAPDSYVSHSTPKTIETCTASGLMVSPKSQALVATL